MSLITPLGEYIAPFQPLANITPFTYRDGVTNLGILEGLRCYVNETLVDFVNTNFGKLGTDFETQVNLLITQVETQLTAQNTAAQEQFNAQDASVDTKLTDITTFVNDSVQSIINSTIAVSDSVVLAILNDTETQSRILVNQMITGEIGTEITGLDLPNTYIPKSDSGLLNTAFSNADSIVFTDNIYTAWPYGSLILDENRGWIGQAYTAGLAHAADAGAAKKKAIFRRRRLGGGSESAPIVLSDLTGSNIDSEVNAMGIAPNGDYVALVRTGSNTTDGEPNNYFSIRSTDGGATWGAGVQIQNTSFADLKPQGLGGWFVTSNGTTLTGAWLNFGTQGLRILRNTDPNSAFNKWNYYGVGGINTDLIAGGAVTYIEPAFAQFNDGTIITIFRQIISWTDYAPVVHALMSVSTDDGITWSVPVETNIEMNNNPCAILHDTYTDSIEVISGDRHPQTDGKSSLWRYVATREESLAGTFGTATRIIKGASARDFGYPAAIRLRDGRTLLRWYDQDNGQADTAQIHEIWGKSPSSAAFAIPEIPETPGVMVPYPATLTGWNANAVLVSSAYTKIGNLVVFILVINPGGPLTGLGRFALPFPVNGPNFSMIGKWNGSLGGSSKLGNVRVYHEQDMSTALLQSHIVSGTYLSVENVDATNPTNVVAGENIFIQVIYRTNS